MFHVCSQINQLCSICRVWLITLGGWGGGYPGAVLQVSVEERGLESLPEVVQRVCGGGGCSRLWQMKVNRHYRKWLEVTVMLCQVFFLLWFSDQIGVDNLDPILIKSCTPQVARLMDSNAIGILFWVKILSQVVYSFFVLSTLCMSILKMFLPHDSLYVISKGSPWPERITWYFT